jgi:predicted permease
MSLARRLGAWLLDSLRRSRTEREMDAELRFHIECYAADLVRGGVPRQEAERRARVEFGALEACKDECREALGFRILDELRADLRYALRMLRRAPVFTAVAVASLGLGIGANAAIFSLMETALWKSAPVGHPGQLRLLSWTSSVAEAPFSVSDVPLSDGGNRVRTSFSYAVFQELRRQHPGFESLCAFKPIGRVTALIDGRAEFVTAHLVSGNFHQSLGIVPIAGRPIESADEAQPGEGSVAVISDAFWLRRFGREASVLGSRINLNGASLTVVGVNPPGFTGMQTGSNPDIFVPLTMQPLIAPQGKNGNLLSDPEFWWLPVMGRLRPDFNQAQAQAALDVLLQQVMRASLPGTQAKARLRLRLVSGARGLDTLSHPYLRKPLLVLASLAGLVLLLACANVASLLLARAGARQREVGMRVALGASSGRIARQMLTEGLVLAALGGVAGLLFGYWTRNGIPRLLGTSWTAAPFQAEFDWRVVCITLAVALFSGLLFSLLPTWHSTRADINPALNDGARATASPWKRTAGQALVAGQVGLSVVLLVGAGLFIRTVWNLKSVDPGFQPERVLLFTLDPPVSRYEGERRVALFERIEERVAALPGVQSASRSIVPLVARQRYSTDVSASPGLEEAHDAYFNHVGDRFFDTMGIPILYGRPLGRADGRNAPAVAVVNEQFARVFFPHENPLGKTFGMPRGAPTTFRIVGICGDTRYRDLRQPVPPTFYLAAGQAPDFGDEITFAVKTAASQAGIVRAIRDAVRSVDRELPAFDFRTQEQQIDATLSQERLFAALTSTFGALALILTCLGIYGILANSVAQRKSEIGIRMALGARPRQMLGLILREAGLLAGLGILAGLLAAAGLTRYLRSMLSGLEPTDPWTFGGVALLMSLVALLAGWWPARRASRLPPMTALRHE